MKYTRLNDADEKVFLEALWSCFDAVADDLFRYRKPRKSTLPRSEVIDVALDQFCMGHNLRMPSDQYKRIREWVMSTPMHIQIQVAKKKFTTSHYGM